MLIGEKKFSKKRNPNDTANNNNLIALEIPQKIKEEKVRVDLDGSGGDSGGPGRPLSTLFTSTLQSNRDVAFHRTFVLAITWES